jgi:hypothetical protein
VRVAQLCEARNTSHVLLISRKGLACCSIVERFKEDVNPSHGAIFVDFGPIIPGNRQHDVAGVGAAYRQAHRNPAHGLPEKIWEKSAALTLFSNLFFRISFPR